MASIGKISVKNWRFEWEIHDFFSYTKQDTRYESPEFSISDTRWCVLIYPNGSSITHSNEYMSFYLDRRDNGTPMVVDYAVGIKTVNRVINCEKKKSYKFSQNGVGWHKFIERSELLRRKLELVPAGILTISCFVKKISSDLDSSFRKLADDLKDLFISQRNTDVTFNVKDKTFSSHKTILEARSPVFAAMFQNDMSEKKTGEINIPDCDPDAFEIFLLFLYSGTVDFSKCSVCELYKITDKYDVSELKLMCADFMGENLSIENFGEALILAYDFDEEKLMSQVQNFFEENFEQIISSDSWKTLFKENFRLANNLLKKLASKVKIIKLN